MLRTHERDVTLLFSDLRGFTEVAASLEIDPLICELLAQVMDCLTDAVIKHQGVVVDYYGDGLFAMWNAPVNQQNHAALACRAALEMLETLPEVIDDWIGVIQTNLRLGIGVHTGLAHIGNAGSSRQTKYGPRGPNVHLASRVEAATKELDLPLVATKPTVQQLSDRFATNRVCRARMPGFSEPLELYAVAPSPSDKRVLESWKTYDEALRQFEQGQFQEALDALASVEAPPAEVPVRFLQERSQRELNSAKRRRSSDQPRAQNGVIALRGK
jgi:adenylate cyclase